MFAWSPETGGDKNEYSSPELKIYIQISIKLLVTKSAVKSDTQFVFLQSIAASKRLEHFDSVQFESALFVETFSQSSFRDIWIKI